MEVLTAPDLAQFTGQDEFYYGKYVNIAIQQATDLFTMATCLDELPDISTLDGRISRSAVLSMAEALYEGQAFRKLRFTPFQNETIGSYSYSLAQKNISSGIPTGIGWFDLAVDRLGICADTATITGSAVSVFDRPGDVRVGPDGSQYLIGPNDINRRQIIGSGLDYDRDPGDELGTNGIDSGYDF